MSNINQSQVEEEVSTDYQTDIIRWWKKLPIINRTFLITCLSIYLLDNIILGNLIQFYLSDSPQTAIFDLHFWAPATTILIHPGIINLLISFIMINEQGQLIEKSLGSIHYFIEIIFKNLCIQLIYLAIMFLLGFIISDSFFLISSQGLLPIAFLLLMLKSLATPEQEIQILCFQQFKIKQKYYPWLILAIFTAFDGLKIDLFTAFLVAFIEVKYFSGKILNFKLTTLQKIENSFFLKKVITRPDFIRCQISSYYQTQVNLQNQQQSQDFEENNFNARNNNINSNQQQQSNLIEINPSIQQNQNQQRPQLVSIREEMRKAAETRKKQNEESRNQQKQIQQQEQSYQSTQDSKKQDENKYILGSQQQQQQQNQRDSEKQQNKKDYNQLTNVEDENL